MEVNFKNPDGTPKRPWWENPEHREEMRRHVVSTLNKMNRRRRAEIRAAHREVNRCGAADLRAAMPPTPRQRPRTSRPAHRRTRSTSRSSPKSDGPCSSSDDPPHLARVFRLQTLSHLIGVPASTLYTAISEGRLRCERRGLDRPVPSRKPRILIAWRDAEDYLRCRAARLQP